MKLSSILSELAEQSKKLEAHAAQWNEQAKEWSESAQENMKQWYDQAEDQYQQSISKFDDVMKDASVQVQSQWDSMQDIWDKKLADAKEHMGEFEEKMKQKTAGDEADAREAYAAGAVKFALQAQKEADDAVQKASEARAKANTQDS